MGDVLTGNRYRRPGEKAADHARNVYSEIIKHGGTIGTHDDTHARGPDCGCGAQYRLDNLETPAKPSILEYITRRGNDPGPGAYRGMCSD